MASAATLLFVIALRLVYKEVPIVHWQLIVGLLAGFALLVYGDVKNRFVVSVFGAVIAVSCWVPLLLHTL